MHSSVLSVIALYDVPSLIPLHSVPFATLNVATLTSSSQKCSQPGSTMVTNWPDATHGKSCFRLLLSVAQSFPPSLKSVDALTTTRALFRRPPAAARLCITIVSISYEAPRSTCHQLGSSSDPFSVCVQVPPSRRRDCHLHDTPCLFLLKHLIYYRGGGSNDSLADGYRPLPQAVNGTNPKGIVGVPPCFYGGPIVLADGSMLGTIGVYWSEDDPLSPT